MNTAAFTDKNHEELRRQGIGGSDIAAILGLSPWKSPFDLWAEKAGLVDPAPMSTRQRVGLALEPLIRDLYQEKTGKVIEGKTCVQHPDISWMIGEIDGFVLGEDRGIEYKSVSQQGRHQDENMTWGAEGSDQVPVPYLVQVAWYQAITQTSLWDLAPLFQTHLGIYTVERDTELEGLLIEAAERFKVDYLDTLKPPPLGDRVSEQTRTTIASLFSTHTEDLKPGSEAMRQQLHMRQVAKRQVAEIEEAIERMEASLKLEVGTHAGLQFSDGSIFTWKKTKDRHIINWQELALHFSPGSDLIAEYTFKVPGIRRVYVKEVIA